MTRRTLFASIAALFGARKAKIAEASRPRTYSYSIQCVTRSGASLSPLQWKNWTTDARVPVNRVEILNQKLWNDHMDQQARAMNPRNPEARS